MISIAGFSFAQHKATFVCTHVLEGRDVLAFFHDEDGDLQLSCGDDRHGDSDWSVIGLEHIDIATYRLTDLPTVSPGQAVIRKSIASPWKPDESIAL